MTSLCFVVQLADRTSILRKGSFFVIIIATRLLLNHSPSEWFSVYNEKFTTGNRRRQVPVVNIADMGCERIRTYTNAYQLQKQNQTQKHKQTHTQQANRNGGRCATRPCIIKLQRQSPFWRPCATLQRMLWIGSPPLPLDGSP